jgi:hypothetical protein
LGDEVVLLELSPPSGDALAFIGVNGTLVCCLEEDKGDRVEEAIELDRLSRIESTCLLARRLLLCISIQSMRGLFSKEDLNLPEHLGP